MFLGQHVKLTYSYVYVLSGMEWDLLPLSKI